MEVCPSMCGRFLFDHAEKRYKNDSYLPVVMRLLFIEGFQFKGNEIISCEIRCSLFDIEENKFIGKTCIEKTVDNGNYGRLNIEKNFYFYASDRKSIAVVIEISVHQRECDYQQSIGWCYIEPFQHARQMDSSSRTPAPHNRINLLCGSPRLLLLLEKSSHRDKEDFLIAPKLHLTELVYTAQSHLSLLKVCHLFPENVLVSGSEIIPGLAPAKKIPVSGAPDNLWKPKLKKCSTCILDNVTVKILPSVSSFEEDMLAKIKEEKIKLENMPSHIDASISERRLNIGIYNGWKYIQEKEVQHLVMDNFRVSHLDLHIAGKGSKKGKSENFGSSFLLRSHVKLLDVPEDAGICVVFVLEYIVTFVQKAKERKSSLPTINPFPTLMVPLSWGKWFLFTGFSKSEIFVKLTSDLTGNPDEKLFYRASDVEMTISFTASIRSEEKELSEPFSDHSETAKVAEAPVPVTDDIAEAHIEEQDSSNEDAENFEVERECEENSSSKKGSPCHNNTVYESTSEYHSFLKEFILTATVINSLLTKLSLIFSKELELTEVMPTGGLQLPILPIVKKRLLSCRPPSRAVYSYLCSVGFPVICDQHGKIPPISEGLCHSAVDFEKEVTDPLHCNDIVIQFLAMSDLTCGKPSTVYFSFEFYRFPSIRTERLFLEDNGEFAKPCILHSLEYDGTKKSCPPGYQVRYHIDPADLSRGEHECFLKYLCEHWMHIDIWDGDSLLYIGTASFQLKYLCRQGQEAVQTILELEIWQVDYAEESADKDIISNFDQLCGILYVKLSNIGSPLSVNSLRKLEDLSASNLPHVQKPEASDGEWSNYNLVRKARPLVELNRSLASFLTSASLTPYADYLNGMSEEKRRKLCRMEAVRKMENDHMNEVDIDLKMFIERMKDLEIIDAYRENHKPEDITLLLMQSITTEMTIHPSKGIAYFFEFELFNPYSKGCRIFVEYQHTNLRIVNDVDEWQHLRELWNVEGRAESQPFSKTSGTGHDILLQPHERIKIPFKYHTFHYDDNVTEDWQAATDHVFSTEILTKYPVSCYYKPVVTKVYFKTEESKIVHILNLHIQPLPPAVDQTFHFIASENAFFKRWIRIPKAALISVSEKAFSNMTVLCSDSSVVCGIQKSGNSSKDPVDVYIKVACSEAGTKCKFFLFIYEKYASKPLQTWQINVTAIYRIDLAVSMGQCYESLLILRGLQATRLVHCYSSHPSELQLSPNNYFTLPANSIQELKLFLQSIVPGTRKMYISMVDIEFHTLLKMWLVVISSEKPTISKAFQLHIPLQQDAIRRIAYTNPYNYPKIFVVYNSHPHILQLAEEKLTLDPKEKTFVGLYFLSQTKPLCEEIYIFLNNMEGKNEETFSVRLTVS